MLEHGLELCVQLERLQRTFLHAEYELDDRSRRWIGALLLPYCLPDDLAGLNHVVRHGVVQPLALRRLVQAYLVRAAHASSLGIEDGEDTWRLGQRAVDPPYQVLEPVQRLRERVGRLPLLGLLDLGRGRIRQLGVPRDVIGIA